MPLPNLNSGYQTYLNQRGGSPRTPASGWTPETFDRSWLMPGGQYYATPETRQSWESEHRKRGGRTMVSSWQGGKYGWRGSAGAPWRPFQSQPGMSPGFIRNPASYQRNELMDQYQTAMDEAKAKTEERYQEALKNLEDVGVQEGRDIDTRFDSSRTAVNQSLIDSGLSGTSVLPSMRRGVERERTSAQNRLASMLARERNQIIQSRNDIPPDLQMLMNLMFQQGTGGGR